jgi:hypothetical protein
MVSIAATIASALLPTVVRALMIAQLSSDNLIRQEGGTMGGFLLGIIVGIAVTLAFVIYDEGEYFLRLHRGVKRTMERYKQQTS